MVSCTIITHILTFFEEHTGTFNLVTDAHLNGVECTNVATVWIAQGPESHLDFSSSGGLLSYVM